MNVQFNMNANQTLQNQQNNPQQNNLQNRQSNISDFNNFLSMNRNNSDNNLNSNNQSQDPNFIQNPNNALTVQGRIILNTKAKKDTDPCAYICNDNYQWQAINAEQLLEIINTQQNTEMVQKRKFIDADKVETYYIQLDDKYFKITKNKTTYNYESSTDKDIAKIINNNTTYINKNIDEELLPSYYYLDNKIYINNHGNEGGQEFTEVTKEKLIEISKNIHSNSCIRVNGITYFNLECTNLSGSDDNLQITKYYKADANSYKTISNDVYNEIKKTFNEAIMREINDKLVLIIETEKLKRNDNIFNQNENDGLKYTLFSVNDKTGEYTHYAKKDYESVFSNKDNLIIYTDAQEYLNINENPPVYIVHNIGSDIYTTTDKQPEGLSLHEISHQTLKRFVKEQNVVIMCNDDNADLYLKSTESGRMINDKKGKQKIVKSIIKEIEESHQTSSYIMHGDKCYYFDEDNNIIILDPESGALKQLNQDVKNEKDKERYKALKEIWGKFKTGDNKYINVKLKTYEQAFEENNNNKHENGEEENEEEEIDNNNNRKDDEEDKQYIISQNDNKIEIVEDITTDIDHKKIHYKNEYSYFIQIDNKWYQQQNEEQALTPAEDDDSTMCDTIITQKQNIFFSDETSQFYQLIHDEQQQLITVNCLLKEEVQGQFKSSVIYDGTCYIKDTQNKDNPKWYQWRCEEQNIEDSYNDYDDFENNEDNNEDGNDEEKQEAQNSEYDYHTVNEINYNKISTSQKKAKSIFKRYVDNTKQITCVTDKTTLSILNKIEFKQNTQIIQNNKQLLIVDCNNETSKTKNNDSTTYKVKLLTHEIIKEQGNNPQESTLPYTICESDDKKDFSIIYYNNKYYQIDKEGNYKQYNDNGKINVFNRVMKGNSTLTLYGGRLYTLSNNRIKSEDISVENIEKLAEKDQNIYHITIDSEDIYAYVMELDKKKKQLQINIMNNVDRKYHSLVKSLVKDLHLSKDKQPRVIPYPFEKTVKQNPIEIPEAKKEELLKKYNSLDNIAYLDQEEEYVRGSKTTDIGNIKDTKYYLFDINPKTRTVSTLSSTISTSTLDKPKDDKYNSKKQTLQIVKINDEIVLLRKDKTEKYGNCLAPTQTTAFVTTKTITNKKNDDDTMFEYTTKYNELINNQTGTLFKIVDENKNEAYRFYLCYIRGKIYQVKHAKQSSDKTKPYKMDEYTQPDPKLLFSQLHNALNYPANNLLLVSTALDDKEQSDELFINVQDTWFKVTEESITKAEPEELEYLEVCQKMKEGKKPKQSNEFIISKTGTNKFSVSSLKNHVKQQGHVYLTAKYVKEDKQEEQQEEKQEEKLKIYQDNAGQWFFEDLQAETVTPTTYSQVQTKMRNKIELTNENGETFEYVPLFGYMLELKTVHKGAQDNPLGKTTIFKNTARNMLNKIKKIKQKMSSNKRKKKINHVAEAQSKPFSKTQDAKVANAQQFWKALVYTVNQNKNKDCDYKIIKYKKDGEEITKQIAYLNNIWYEIDTENNKIIDIDKFIKQPDPDDNDEEHNIMRQLLNAKNTYKISSDQEDYYITETDVDNNTVLKHLQSYIYGLDKNGFNDQQNTAYNILFDKLASYLDGADQKLINEQNSPDALQRLLEALNTFITEFPNDHYIPELIDAISGTKPLRKQTAFKVDPENSHILIEVPAADDAIELQTNIKLIMKKFATHAETDRTSVKVYKITLPEEKDDKKEKDKNKMKFKRVLAIHRTEFPEAQWEKYKEKYNLDTDILYVYEKTESGFYPILSKKEVETLQQIKDNKIKYNPQYIENMKIKEQVLFGDEGDIEIYSYPHYNKVRNHDHLRFYKRIKLAEDGKENDKEYILVDCEPREIDTIKNCLTSNQLQYQDGDDYKDIFKKDIKTELKSNKAKGKEYNKKIKNVGKNYHSEYSLINTNNVKKKSKTDIKTINKKSEDKYYKRMQNSGSYTKKSKKTNSNIKISNLSSAKSTKYGTKYSGV